LNSSASSQTLLSLPRARALTSRMGVLAGII
jgi:hypothetical protein